MKISATLCLSITVFFTVAIHAQNSGTVREAWVRHYVSGLAPGYDAATDMAIDGKENVYVTGYSTKPGFGADYLTVKYDVSGKEVWAVPYSDVEHGDDLAYAIAVDTSANVYVTGKSWSGSSFDYVTIKYDSNGVRQWLARYNGSGDDYDEATAVAVDNAGNVYVTGTSTGIGTSTDYVTIKYNSAGVQQWAIPYNGPGSLSDKATAIVVKPASAGGGVYVTGRSVGAGTGYDYATIKYNESGIRQWAARYNGLKNLSDFANALVVDDSGNVYVTGGSDGIGSSTSYATVKYNSTGVEKWVARRAGYEGYDNKATALVVDDKGNVYVTGTIGSVGSEVNYVTIKYNSTGAQQWDAQYGGPGSWYAEAKALTIDDSGNVYVTGMSASDYATVKYSAAGVQQWAVRYNGPGNRDDFANAIAVDTSGNVYITGENVGSGTSSDYATIKYNSGGIEQWTARYNGSGNSDEEVYAMTIDGSGNVYVAGRSKSASTGDDYAIVKYNTFGVEQWTARYHRSTTDIPSAITVDGAGNVYVTGKSLSRNFYDYTTVKYNASGVLQWEAYYNFNNTGSGIFSDEAAALAVDGAGNVYVTGKSYGIGASANYDYATIKYNSDGIPQWAERYNGSGNANDEATGLVVDAAGNVYVTGTSEGSGTYSDYVTIKYNSKGVRQWEDRYNSSENANDYARAIAVDGSGNVYVTGSSYSYALVTIKYDSLGVRKWVARYDGRYDANVIAVDGSGNVYVAGSSGNISSLKDYVTIKYDSLGNQQWIARYNPTGAHKNEVTALAVDSFGNVYVTGWSEGVNTSNVFSTGYGSATDFATIKYNAAGAEQWVARYNGPGNDLDGAVALALDGSGNVYVAGTSRGFAIGSFYYGWSIFTTIKYSQDQDTTRPASPQNLQAEVIDRKVKLTWTANTESDLLRYRIYRNTTSPANTKIDSVAAGTTTYWDSNVVNGVTYFYRITAVDQSLNQSGFSNEASATPSMNDPPRIANAIPDQTLWVGGFSFTRDLNEPPAVFNDPDGDALTYGVSSSDTNIANANLSNNTLLVATPVAVGSAAIKITAKDGKGDSDSTTFNVTVKPPPTLTIPNTSALPSASFDVPIRISDAAGIAGAAIKITFDANILTAIGAQKTSLTSDFLLADTISSGKIALGLARATGIAGGSGDLVTLTFRVNPSATPGDTTTLVFAKLFLFDENTNPIPANGVNGLFTVTPRINNAPEVRNFLQDTTLVVGCGNFVRDLNVPLPVFTDKDGDTLIYSTNSSNESVAKASINKNILSVTPMTAGMAEITVTADDRKGGVIWTKFWVTVLEASCDGITVSPNPFTPNDDGFNDHVDFKFSRKYTQQPEVLIFNIAGKRVKRLSTANAGILKWQGVDDDGQALEPGVYIYIIKSNGQNISNGTITLMR